MKKQKCLKDVSQDSKMYCCPSHINFGSSLLLRAVYCIPELVLVISIKQTTSGPLISVGASKWLSLKYHH